MPPSPIRSASGCLLFVLVYGFPFSAAFQSCSANGITGSSGRFRKRASSLRLRSSSSDETEDDPEAARRRYSEMLNGGLETSNAAPSAPIRTSSPSPKLAAPVRRKKNDPRPLGVQDANVPADQQPAQELNDLKSEPVFEWAQLEDGEFGAQIMKVYAGIFIFVSMPIALVTYDWQTNLLQALVAANFGTVAFTFFLLVRLYIGWSYVGDRLIKDVGYYEESGWYDGFLSVKPPEVVARDKLLYEYEVEPAVQRVTTFAAAAGALFVASFILLRVAAPTDPYAYLGEDYLQSVLQDDNRAAGEQRRVLERGGSAKPTYCDSRYYRAVAGGGGCR